MNVDLGPMSRMHYGLLSSHLRFNLSRDFFIGLLILLRNVGLGQ